MILLGWEKQLLQKNFHFIEISTANDGLTCIGKVSPSAFSITYTYKVKYKIDKPPKVFPVDPRIEYHDDIHIYPQDNSLCLHYPKDFSWTTSSHLYNTIIPWTHEWYLFYELYQIYGKWLHPSVLHTKSKQEL